MKIAKQRNKVITQLFGYIISGLYATAAHFTTLFLLVEKLIVSPVIASSIGFLIGAIVGFSLNRKFVFKDPSAKQAAFLKYCLLAGISAILNAVLLSALIYELELYYMFAQLLVTISIVLFNFTCCKLWIFKESTEPMEPIAATELKELNNAKQPNKH